MRGVRGDAFPLVSRGTRRPSRQETATVKQRHFRCFLKSSLLKYFPKWLIEIPYFEFLFLSVGSYIYMYIYTNIHVDILLCRITATPGRSRTFNLIKQIKPNAQPLALAWAQAEPGLP